jgi:histidinol-phosphate aminotransferase
MTERPALSKLQPYVPGRKREGAVKLASNENPLGPSPRALAATREIADQIHVYPDKNMEELRRALARRSLWATVPTRSWSCSREPSSTRAKTL